MHTLNMICIKKIESWISQDPSASFREPKSDFFASSACRRLHFAERVLHMGKWLQLAELWCDIATDCLFSKEISPKCNEFRSKLLLFCRNICKTTHKSHSNWLRCQRPKGCFAEEQKMQCCHVWFRHLSWINLNECTAKLTWGPLHWEERKVGGLDWHTTTVWFDC